MKKLLLLLLVVCFSLCSQTLPVFCGEPTVVTLFAGKYIDSGSVTVRNDSGNLYVTYTTKDGWALVETHLAVATSLSLIPQTPKGNPKNGLFPFKRAYNPPVVSDEYVISLDQYGYVEGTVLYIAAHAALVKIVNGAVVQSETGWGNGTGFPGNNWAMYFMYVVQPCKPPVTDLTGLFRTQTQGGWGTGCKGENPGCYRDAHFALAFPNGLRLGSTDGFSILLTSSAAVEDFLPQGGPASKLTMNHVDPTTSEAGVLAGQVCAVSLSVGFDLADPDFCKSPVLLKNLIFKDPGNEENPFNGMTVEQILAIANVILSGLSQPYSYSLINDAVSKINENFVDGKMDGGFLSLP